MPIIRTLCAHEREALLDLLDGWKLADGWRGRDFFRRYVEDDPSYADENVHVAEDEGRLVSCVQIFPRAVRGQDGVALPAGGIGSVFTAESARGSGAAKAVLESALTAMRARGMLLSLLFASPKHVAPDSLYGRLGFSSWPSTRLLWRPGPDPDASLDGLEVDAFDPARDAAAVHAIHGAYSGARPGTLVRDTAAWRASRRLAGNPREELLVARRDDEVVAYARTVVLYGMLQVSEVGRVVDGAETSGANGGGAEAASADALAALVTHVLSPRDDEVFASHGRPSGELRGAALAPDPRDAALAAALTARGVAAQALPDPSPMLACLDADGLAAACGTLRERGESAAALLQRVLPPERFVFWPADRF